MTNLELTVIAIIAILAVGVQFLVLRWVSRAFWPDASVSHQLARTTGLAAVVYGVPLLVYLAYLAGVGDQSAPVFVFVGLNLLMILVGASWSMVGSELPSDTPGQRVGCTAAVSVATIALFVAIGYGLSTSPPAKPASGRAPEVPLYGEVTNTSITDPFFGLYMPPSQNAFFLDGFQVEFPATTGTAVKMGGSVMAFGIFPTTNTTSVGTLNWEDLGGRDASSN